jgi:hypothetical protein
MADENQKTCLIKQPAGLGDIFFLQKVASHFISNGYHVVWPVLDIYSWVIPYIERDGITFCSDKDDFPYKKYYNQKNLIIKEDFTFLPLECADQILGIPPMKAKYPLVHLSSDGWQEHFNFKRNKRRELFLKAKLGLREKDEFVFVNDMLGSPPSVFHRPMNIPDDYKVVRNSFDFQPFDYCWVLENAKEIHTVETCFCYMIEKLNTTDKLFMYSRMVGGKQQHADFSYVDFIYGKNWETIQ